MSSFPLTPEALEERLKRVPPEYRAMFRTSHAAALENETNPRKRRQCELADERREQERLERYRRVAKACLAGKWGTAHQGLARDLLKAPYGDVIRDDMRSLEHFISEAAMLDRSE